jgi:hypothetical protein
MNDDIYVFDGVEVKKTGREAIRKVPLPGNKAPREMVLIEIRTLDYEEGGNFGWKKWVNPNELYEIQPPRG